MEKKDSFVCAHQMTTECFRTTREKEEKELLNWKQTKLNVHTSLLDSSLIYKIEKVRNATNAGYY